MLWREVCPMQEHPRPRFGNPNRSELTLSLMMTGITRPEAYLDGRGGQRVTIQRARGINGILR
jgi:hypothetical protein